ncbi:unnamed protein product [Effrenium voratum]|nr:unnamed protein product [Effrenium voratum]
MLTKEQYADRCLIIVGCGREADELLCQRRLKAGGRLAHFTCRGENDPRVTVDRAADLGKSFFWRPPVEDVVSTLGKKIGALQRRRRKKGLSRFCFWFFFSFSSSPNFDTNIYVWKFLKSRFGWVSLNSGSLLEKDTGQWVDNSSFVSNLRVNPWCPFLGPKALYQDGPGCSGTAG